MKTLLSASKSETKRIALAPRTYGGGIGAIPKDGHNQLLRQVATCMLWEPTHYETGDNIAKLIYAASLNCSLGEIADIAGKARGEFKLRHIPLFLLAIMDERREENPSLVGDTITAVIQRADEMAEFLAIHAKVFGYGGGEIKNHLSHQVKRGLANAFNKFDEYQFAKYNRDTEIKLRDIMFLVHPKPTDVGRAAMFNKIADDTLETPDTWEVALSTGKDKKAAWGHLLSERKLGDMALLRNLRNMEQAGVDRDDIRLALLRAKFTRVLPFRFITAAKHAPHLEEELGQAMMRAMAPISKMNGSTLIVLDVSGSMRKVLSGFSEVDRIDTASGLAMLAREVCEDVTIYATAGNDLERKHATTVLPNRHAFALRDAFVDAERKLGGGGIFLVQCMDYIDQQEHGKKFDRVLVVTDEQDCDDRDMAKAAARSKLLGKANYILNVAPYVIGLDTRGAWKRINGFSERVFDYIDWDEKQLN
jgi:hypothetical protein